MAKKSSILVALLVVAAFIVLVLAAGLCWIRCRHKRSKDPDSSSTGATEGPGHQLSGNQPQLTNQTGQSRTQGENNIISIPYHVFHRANDPPLIFDHLPSSRSHEDPSYNTVSHSNATGIFPLKPRSEQPPAEPGFLDPGVVAANPALAASVAEQRTTQYRKSDSNVCSNPQSFTSQPDCRSSLPANSGYNPTGLDFGLAVTGAKPASPCAPNYRNRLGESLSFMGSDTRLEPYNNNNGPALVRDTERSPLQMPFEDSSVEQPSRSPSNFSSLSYLRPEPLFIRKANSAGLPVIFPHEGSINDGPRMGYRSELINSRENMSPGLESAKSFCASRHIQSAQYNNIPPEDCNLPFTIDSPSPDSMELYGQDQRILKNRYSRLPASDNLDDHAGKGKGKSTLPVESILSEDIALEESSYPPNPHHPSYNKYSPGQSYIPCDTEAELQDMSLTHHAVPYERIKAANEQSSEYKSLPQGDSIPLAESGNNNVRAVKAKSNKGDGNKAKKMKKYRVFGMLSWARRHA